MYRLLMVSPKWERLLPVIRVFTKERWRRVESIVLTVHRFRGIPGQLLDHHWREGGKQTMSYDEQQGPPRPRSHCSSLVVLHSVHKQITNEIRSRTPPGACTPRADTKTAMCSSYHPNVTMMELCEFLSLALGSKLLAPCPSICYLAT